MSYIYLQEQGEESSAGCFSDIPQYVLSRLNLTAERSCSNDNEMESCPSSQSGMMSAPSMEYLGEEGLMSSAGDSHAKTSAQPVRVLESKANEADSGKRWQGLLVKYDQDMFLSKTVLCSEQEDSALFLKTLPNWGIMQDGELFQLRTPALYTREKGFGFWQTPTRGDYRGASHGAKFGVRKKNFDQWNVGRKSAYPNPLALEELMMWPIAWTELNPLGMDKFQQWQHSHGMS